MIRIAQHVANVLNTCSVPENSNGTVLWKSAVLMVSFEITLGVTSGTPELRGLNIIFMKSSPDLIGGLDAKRVFSAYFMWIHLLFLSLKMLNLTSRSLNNPKKHLLSLLFSSSFLMPSPLVLTLPHLFSPLLWQAFLFENGTPSHDPL